MAKQELEARETGIEFGSHERWGGEVELEGGKRYYVNPQAEKPAFPISLRATRPDVV
ncbi:NifT/FixU family protein [Pectobacterium atrosepticum]|uniref:NifT/FixU family protein n=1 Tax=Pectobacterium atrosepticum TaxID=29471 RepID=UPI00203E5CA2|nr:NifT/FixU family protein [Pectobacterium atrosepticum]